MSRTSQDFARRARRDSHEANSRVVMPLNSSIALNQPTPRSGPRLFPRAHPADANGFPPRPELPEGSVMPKAATAVSDFTPPTSEQAATTSRSPPAERATSPQSGDEARPGSSLSNRNSRSSKKNSLVAFLTLKEPSTKALEDFADAEREKAKQKGTTPPAAPPGVSTQKLPDYVPKVNSKWDGMPESASRKSADLGSDDGKRKQSMSSKHSRRSPNSSNPSASSPDQDSRPTSSTAVMRNLAAAGLYEADGSGSDSAGSGKPSPSAAAAAPESRSVEPKPDEPVLAPILRPYEPPIPPRSPERKSFQLNMGRPTTGEDMKTSETTLPKINHAPIQNVESTQPDYAGLQVVSAPISEVESDRRQDSVTATTTLPNPAVVRPMSARAAVNFSRPLRPREARPD